MMLIFVNHYVKKLLKQPWIQNFIHGDKTHHG